MKAKKLYFTECHLAGRQYHDADEVWDKLKVGTTLVLEREEDNKHDPFAVKVVFRSLDKKTDRTEDYLLGYIPRAENEVIANFLDMGWTEVFECRISKICPDAHYENQIRLTIRIKRNGQL